MSKTQKIGKYEIIEKIGEGGFGEVFKVYDPDLQVERAVKIPFSQGENIDKSLSEARKQAKISHTSVIQVHHVDKIDGKWTIIMDYAGGGNLREKLKKEGLLPLDQSIRYIEALAGAVAEAHKNDLLHYDIKPENILFDDDGNIKLADFGIARQMERTGDKMSRVVGTLEYMGPEQLNGIEDPKSEIWSLGAVFYEMLTGKICFEGKNDAETIQKIQSCDFVRLKKIKAYFPERVENMVNRMLCPDPSGRYRTMEEVVCALKDFREEKAAPKRKSHAAIIIGFILVFLFSFGGGAIYAHRASIFSIPFFDRPGKVKNVSIPETIKHLGYKDMFKKGLSLIETGQYQLAYEIFDDIGEHGDTLELKEKGSFYKASMALNYMKDTKLAFSDFKSFSDKYPHASGIYAGRAHFYLGQIYFEKKHDFYRAIKHLALVIEKYPEDINVEAAKILVRKAGIQLVKKKSSAGLKIESVLNGFLPNNVLSLIVSVLGLISALSMPLAWIMTQYQQPEITHPHSLGSSFKDMMKHKAVKKLIIIVIISQIFSFALTQYQKNLEYQTSAQSLHNIGVVIDGR